LDYKSAIDGVLFEGGQAESQVTEIVEERFIPGFAAGIIGMKAGETKNVEAKFPDDYSNQELGGKTAVFKILTCREHLLRRRFCAAVLGGPLYVDAEFGGGA
jgi:FKBP-type peptidyl-prolyl cis-trans isomerase (trigger factor)